MSSWERSRRIPWSRVKQPGPDEEKDFDLEQYKSRVYKELQYEAELQETLEKEETNKKRMNTINYNSSTDYDSQTSFKEEKEKKIIQGGLLFGGPNLFTYGDLFKRALFGVTLGSITGATFGFMDSMRQVQDNQNQKNFLKNASTKSKAQFIFQGTSRSGLLFGGFFGGFHVGKYLVRILAEPGDYAEIGVAAATSMGAMFYKPQTRTALPYFSMLILFDSVQVYLNKNPDD